MSYTTSTPYNTTKDLNVSDLITLNPNWVITSSSLVHNGNLGSFVQLAQPGLVTGNTYRVTYTVSSYTSCIVKAYLGTWTGIERTSAGTFVEEFVFNGEKILKFYATGTVTINSFKIEIKQVTIDETLVDNTTLVNNSWTLSYSPILNQWLSYHSYLPNNYIQHPTKLIAKRSDTQLKLMNSGDFGKFFDADVKPFILELVFNDFPTETKIFDSVTVNLDSTFNKVNTNKFFDSLYVYNEYQCSGTITLDATNLTKKERNWNFHKFNDIVNSTSNTLFATDWTNIGPVYPIDKVINPSKIDTSKPWYQRGRMRDKYITIRFIENNLENNKLMCKFVTTIFRKSVR